MVTKRIHTASLPARDQSPAIPYVYEKLSKHLKAAVQGVCRVRVDEVGFGEAGGEGLSVVDKRIWE